MRASPPPGLDATPRAGSIPGVPEPGAESRASGGGRIARASHALLAGWRGLPIPPWAVDMPRMLAAWDRGARRREVAARNGWWRPRAGMPLPSGEVRAAIRKAVAAAVAAQDAAAGSAPRATLPAAAVPERVAASADAG